MVVAVAVMVALVVAVEEMGTIVAMLRIVAYGSARWMRWRVASDAR